MSQHTSWLLSSSPWLSDSWSHGPSFNTCLWWLIWTSTSAFWILSHYSALTCTHSSNVRIPTSFQKLSPSSFSKGTLGTQSPEHLWVCSGTHLPHPVLTFVLDVYIQDHTRLHSCVHDGSWVQHPPILPSSSHLPRSMLLKDSSLTFVRTSHPPCGRLCVLSLILSFSVWLWSIHCLLASLILRQRDKMQ